MNRNLSSTGEIQHDGRVRFGQAYASPRTLGDVTNESYRIGTFLQYPDNGVDTRQLAAAGFFFTGFGDGVKCFSCLSHLDHLSARDDPTSSVWHLPTCTFYNRTFGPHPGSILEDRRRSSLPGVVRTRTVETVPVAGITERLGGITINFGHNTTRISNPVQRTLDSSERNETTFPCRNAVNPHMRDVNSRLQTFRDHIDRWSQFGLRATPLQVAQAGMFYLGERDKVKCWFCNGGLQDWDRDDEPWTEHAKWYPTCNFVLEKKGRAFVDRIFVQFPDLRQPSVPQTTTRRQVVSGVRYPSVASTSRPHTTDGTQTSRYEFDRKIDQEMRNSPIIAYGTSMGFDRNQIRTALKRKYESDNEPFACVEDLVYSLLGQEASSSRSIAAEGEPAVGSRAPEDTAQEIRRLEESRKCKRCRQHQADVVLIPCGHMACCVQCKNSVRSCPVCNRDVIEKVRVYVA